MAKNQYNLFTRGNWMASSGNAILAMVNKIGSGKKINIHNVAIYNNNKLGFVNGAANINAPAPMRFLISQTSGVYGGDSLTPVSMDSQASFPSTVKVTTNNTFIPKFVRRSPVYTPTAAVTAASGTFTPTTAPAPAWVASEHRDAGRYFICVSGAGNVGTLTGNITNTSNIITGITDFSNMFVGNYVTGTGIPTYAYVTSIDIAAKTITISGNASATTTALAITCHKIYRVIANTTTALTVDPPFAAAVVTGGYIADIEEIAHGSIQKQLNTSTTGSIPVTNFGQINRKDVAPGGLFDSSMHTNCQEIVIRAGENVSVYSDIQNCSLPMFVSADIIVAGTPNRTYTVEFYTYLTSPQAAIFSINNTTGSGQIISLENIDISECGTTDTCYFRLVPFAAMDAQTYSDATNRLISSQVFANDSTAPSISSILDWYTNTPVLPFGVPVSYMSASSPGASTVPVGYNYLNTKDFIGPMWMCFFPEGASWKPDNQTGMWTISNPSDYGAHYSEKLSSIKGMYAPIVIREGEGFAITSGAETAAGATVNSVGVSGWAGFDFNIIFSVEDARYPTITLQNVYAGSRWRIETVPSLTGLGDNGTILVNASADGNNFVAANGTTVSYLNNGDGTYDISYQYTDSTPQPVRTRVRRSSTGTVRYLPFESKFNLTSADQSIPVTQQVDAIVSP